LLVVAFSTHKSTDDTAASDTARSNDNDANYYVGRGGQPEGVPVERVVAVGRLVRVGREVAER